MPFTFFPLLLTTVDWTPDLLSSLLLDNDVDVVY